MTLEEQREMYYQQRIGKVYGVWKVIKVERDESCCYKQKWTLQCIKCGRIKETRIGDDYVRGKVGKHCSCMSLKNQPKTKKETRTDFVNKNIGKIIGNWKVIGYKEHKGVEVECVNCGRRAYKPLKPLFNGVYSRCVCEFKNKYDESYIGKRYGHLVVIGISHQKLDKDRLVFECKCDCGNTKTARPLFLEQGSVVCCGDSCIYKNESYKLDFGTSKDALYVKWSGMKQRCYNDKCIGYKSYGGRGIKICDEWLGESGYSNFYKWSIENGYKEGLTIDRIDPDKDYEPSNCRYITLSENSSLARHPKKVSNSKYANVRVVINGEVCDLETACLLTGCIKETIRYRVVVKGMSWQEAFDTMPFTKGRPRTK